MDAHRVHPAHNRGLLPSRQPVPAAHEEPSVVRDVFGGGNHRRTRRLDCPATNLGAFLDTVADKLVVCSAIVVLLSFDRVDMLIALIIVGREITVTALREWMSKIGKAASVKVNWFGKIKAIAQMVAIPMLLFYDPFMGLPIFTIGTVMIWIAAVLTIYSMCVYLLAAWPYLQRD